MPILYVHGVNVRSRDGFQKIKPYLRRLVAPTISDQAENVLIDDCYWGNLAADFAWDGDSRPKSQLLGQGATGTGTSQIEQAHVSAAHASVLSQLPAPSSSGATGGLISGSAASAGGDPLRLKDLPAEELSDLLGEMIYDSAPDDQTRASFALAADEIARDPQTAAALGQADSIEKEVEWLLTRVEQTATGDTALVGMGGGIVNWFKGIGDRISESFSRAKSAPAYALSVAAAELRKPLNELLSVFLGDVFVYLRERGEPDAPGPIQKRLLAKLKECWDDSKNKNDEPIVVVSHSMGGQLVYDAITSFLPANESLNDMRIDFWCATASQVGFFEEIKLFLSSSEDYMKGNPVPFPDSHLGMWWNVWDYNDFLSFTVRDIVRNVDDNPYSSGMSLLAAHGGYLQRPSFYRQLAAKLDTAKQQNWNRP